MTADRAAARAVSNRVSNVVSNQASNRGVHGAVSDGEATAGRGAGLTVSGTRIGATMVNKGAFARVMLSRRGHDEAMSAVLLEAAGDGYAEVAGEERSWPLRPRGAAVEQLLRSLSAAQAAKVARRLDRDALEVALRVETRTTVLRELLAHGAAPLEQTIAVAQEYDLVEHVAMAAARDGRLVDQPALLLAAADAGAGLCGLLSRISSSAGWTLPDRADERVRIAQTLLNQIADERPYRESEGTVGSLLEQLLTCEQVAVAVANDLRSSNLQRQALGHEQVWDLIARDTLVDVAARDKTVRDRALARGMLTWADIAGPLIRSSSRLYLSEIPPEAAEHLPAHEDISGHVQPTSDVHGELLDAFARSAHPMLRVTALVNGAPLDLVDTLRAKQAAQALPFRPAKDVAAVCRRSPEILSEVRDGVTLHLEKPSTARSGSGPAVTGGNEPEHIDELLDLLGDGWARALSINATGMLPAHRLDEAALQNASHTEAIVARAKSLGVRLSLDASLACLSAEIHRATRGNNPHDGVVLWIAGRRPELAEPSVAHITALVEQEPTLLPHHWVVSAAASAGRDEVAAAFGADLRVSRFEPKVLATVVAGLAHGRVSVEGWKLLLGLVEQWQGTAGELVDTVVELSDGASPVAA